MHFTRSTVAFVASLSFFASAQSIRGFNTGSTLSSGAGKSQSEFQAEFQNQRSIAGTNGAFSNARLYTMIQGGTTNSPISAIPAAIASNTGLLLGLWGSAGQDSFNEELAALSAAIKQYGPQMAPLVRGISVGSEDLYRVSPTGIANNAGVGAGPDILTSYIAQVRNAIKGTVLANAQIGHVDTWNAWTNSSNAAVAKACDWVGVDEYPYYQSTDDNTIANAGKLFYNAYDAVRSATGKPTWVTETGYPSGGPKFGDAVASVANARDYWLQVYCTLPADVPVYWYTQVNDGDAAEFGITGASLSTTPVYDLSCKNTTSSSTTSAHSSTATSSKLSDNGVATYSSKASDSKPTPSGASGYSSTSRKAGSGPVYGSTLTRAPYPTGSEPAAVGVATGTVGTVPVGTGTTVPTFTSTTTTPSATATPPGSSSNGASNVQSTLALLAVPALLALFL